MSRALLTAEAIAVAAELPHANSLLDCTAHLAGIVEDDLNSLSDG